MCTTLPSDNRDLLRLTQNISLFFLSKLVPCADQDHGVGVGVSSSCLLPSVSPRTIGLCIRSFSGPKIRDQRGNKQGRYHQNCLFSKLYFSKVGNISKIVKFYTDHEFELGFEIFQRLGNVVNQKKLVKLQIGMLINGLNRTRILIALLYCPRAAHSFSKETRSVKALFLGQSKTSYYKVLLYEHSIYS
jgi:hypothetical protein